MIGAYSTPGADVVLAANHFERIGDRENIRAALEGRESPITQRPVARELRGTEAATDTIFRRLVQAGGITGDTIALASEIGALNSNFRSSARSSSEGENVIEDAIESRIELVNGSIGKEVSFRNCNVTSMIGNVLRAGKSALLGKSRRTARNERYSLIVAEARKNGILAGEIVVEANIELAFVQLPHWNVGVVVTQRCVLGVGCGIEID